MCFCSGCFQLVCIETQTGTQINIQQKEDSLRSALPPPTGTSSHPSELPEHTAFEREEKHENSADKKPHYDLILNLILTLPIK